MPTTEPRNILIIEDNHDLAQLLALHLRDLSFSVNICSDGLAGLAEGLSGHYELIILDLMLPKLDGISVCKKLREQPQYVPIFMLTAKAAEFDRVQGLEIGADDYVTKPYSISELLARIKALFRRKEAMLKNVGITQPHLMRRGDIEIDAEKHLVSINKQSVELTAKEFDLLLFLAHEPGRVYTRSQLLDQVWGYGHDGYEHTVNSHINRLRVKIEADPTHPVYILTVWGVGYKFNDALVEAVNVA